MPKTKHPMRRLFRIGALLQTGKPLTCQQIMKDLHQHNFECSEKTVRRDLKTLREDFRVPVVYNPEKRGFVCSHDGWTIEVPYRDNPEVRAALIAAQFAGNTFPPGASEELTRTMNELVVGNPNDGNPLEGMEHLKVPAGSGEQIDLEVWETVLDAWQQRRILQIQYQRDSDVLSRSCEPHVLAFQKSRWVLHSWDLEKNDVRIFALEKIRGAAMCEESFGDRPEMQNVNSDQIHDRLLRNVHVRCTGDTAAYVQRAFRPEQIRTQGDQVVVHFPAIWERKLMNWIWRCDGEAEVIQPDHIRTAVLQRARRIWERHERGGKTNG